MEDALELANYLPLFFKTQNERKYIDFLWGAFDKGLIYESAGHFVILQKAVSSLCVSPGISRTSCRV